MFSKDDLTLWAEIKRTIKPLLGMRSVEPTPFPKRLRVYAPPPRELQDTLDLHGLTVQEAYQALRHFITLHVRQNTRRIVVITGKGSPHKEGLIHHEIQNWLDAPFFAEKITGVRWLNGGGALEIRLRHRKK